MARRGMQQRKVDYRSRMCGAANKALTRTEGGKSIPHSSCESEQGIRSQWAQLRRLVNGSRDQSSREDALHYCSSLHADWGSTDIEWVDVNWCSLGKRCRFTFSRKHPQFVVREGGRHKQLKKPETPDIHLGRPPHAASDSGILSWTRRTSTVKPRTPGRSHVKEPTHRRCCQKTEGCVCTIYA